jgi:hypothetical protein
MSRDRITRNNCVSLPSTVDGDVMLSHMDIVVDVCRCTVLLATRAVCTLPVAVEKKEKLQNNACYFFSPAGWRWITVRNRGASKANLPGYLHR